jgi:hypothetical protein
MDSDEVYDMFLTFFGRDSDFMPKSSLDLEEELMGDHFIPPPPPRAFNISTS